MKVFTVKELKEMIKDLPDDMKIVQYQEGMERQGYLEGACIKVEKRTPVEVETYDRFDYTEYSYRRYEFDANGIEMLSIN